MGRTHHRARQHRRPRRHRLHLSAETFAGDGSGTTYLPVRRSPSWPQHPRLCPVEGHRHLQRQRHDSGSVPMNSSSPYESSSTVAVFGDTPATSSTPARLSPAGTGASGQTAPAPYTSQAANTSPSPPTPALLYDHRRPPSPATATARAMTTYHRRFEPYLSAAPSPSRRPPRRPPRHRYTFCRLEASSRPRTAPAPPTAAH